MEKRIVPSSRSKQQSRFQPPMDETTPLRGTGLMRSSTFTYFCVGTFIGGAVLLSLAILGFFFPLQRPGTLSPSFLAEFNQMKQDIQTLQTEVQQLNTEIEQLNQEIANISGSLCDADCSNSTFTVDTLVANSFVYNPLDTLLPFLQYGGVEEVTVSNSVTELTLIDPNHVGSDTILANTLGAGSFVALTLEGFYSTENSNPTLTWRVKFNGNELLSTGAVTLPALAVDYGWKLTVNFRVEAAAIMGQSLLTLSTTNTPSFPSVIQPLDTAPDAFDTSIAQQLEVSAQWSSADPLNSLVCSVFYVIIYN